MAGSAQIKGLTNPVILNKRFLLTCVLLATVKRVNRCLKLKRWGKLKVFPRPIVPCCVITCPVGSANKVGEVQDELGYISARNMPLWHAQGQFYFLVYLPVSDTYILVTLSEINRPHWRLIFVVYSQSSLNCYTCAVCLNGSAATYCLQTWILMPVVTC
jgi:hypothetical protein